MPYNPNLPFGYGWGAGSQQNTTPEAEREYFKRVIADGGVEAHNGLFFNDPANDRSKRTWYNEFGQIVKQPGQDTTGPDGHYAAAAGGAGQGTGIEQLMHDMTLQRVAKTFNWQTMPNVKSFQGGGYYWSHDPNTFAVPPQRRQTPGIAPIIQQMIQRRPPAPPPITVPPPTIPPGPNHERGRPKDY